MNGLHYFGIIGVMGKERICWCDLTDPACPYKAGLYKCGIERFVEHWLSPKKKKK